VARRLVTTHDPKRFCRQFQQNFYKKFSSPCMPMLQRRQEGFRLCQGQTDLVDLLARLLQDHHVREGLLVTLVVIYHQVDVDLQGGTPPAR